MVQAVRVIEPVVPERFWTPAPKVAALPETTQAVRERVPPLTAPLPAELLTAAPPVRVRPEIEALPTLETKKTVEAWLALTVSRPAPGPLMALAPPLNRSWPWVRVMVWGVVPLAPKSEGSKSMT